VTLICVGVILLAMSVTMAVIWAPKASRGITPRDAGATDEPARTSDHPETPTGPSGKAKAATAAVSPPAVNSMIAKWLRGDGTAEHVAPRDRWPVTSAYKAHTVLLSPSLGVERTPLGAGGEPRAPGDEFGYSVDASAGVLCVGSPGHMQGAGRVSLFLGGSPDSPLTYVCATNAPHGAGPRFGRGVKVTDGGRQVLVQSERDTHAYTVDGQEMVGAGTLQGLGRNVELLCAGPDGTLWVRHHGEGTMSVWERGGGGAWAERSRHHVDAMDVVYEPGSRHVWIASHQGLLHWSRDEGGDWSENARWMEGDELTSVTPFSPQSGPHAGVDYLFVGAAQHDTGRLVSAINPHRSVDLVEVPGGQVKGDGVLFGNGALWVEATHSLLVSAPLDRSTADYSHVGGVFVYGLAHDSRLVPQALLRPEVQPGNGGMYGAGMVLIGQGQVVLSNPAADQGAGEVEWVKLSLTTSNSANT